jgi:hypothetical protein
MEGTVIRGSSAVPTAFGDSRADLMWIPPPPEIKLKSPSKSLADELQSRFGDAVKQGSKACDVPTVQVNQSHIKDVLRFLN